MDVGCKVIGIGGEFKAYLWGRGDQAVFALAVDDALDWLVAVWDFVVDSKWNVEHPHVLRPVDESVQCASAFSERVAAGGEAGEELVGQRFVVTHANGAVYEGFHLCCDVAKDRWASKYYHVAFDEFFRCGDWKRRYVFVAVVHGLGFVCKDVEAYVLSCSFVAFTPIPFCVVVFLLYNSNVAVPFSRQGFQ